MNSCGVAVLFCGLLNAVAISRADACSGDESRPLHADTLCPLTDDIRYVRASTVPVLESPEGEVQAHLSRATRVQVTDTSESHAKVAVRCWCPTRQVIPPYPEANRYGCRVAADCLLLDAPWAATWGGYALSFGARMGKILKGASVECFGRNLEATEIALAGWIHVDSLTSNPIDICIPDACESLAIEARGDSTRFVGRIRTAGAKWTSARFRLVVYDYAGSRLHGSLFWVGNTPGHARSANGTTFQITLPVRRSAIATYRVTTPGAGIVSLYR